ncbi:hypothetical protein L2E82_15593 [Cichorium intybus]|uniref:Uncharacterized protein n=1 Tax=Cichorium intybus TaxID=13427 RepID=A0ACB9F3P5_CICIN|nr:hypothetical protein L2E82_15593 [Cichorium intybus]
MVKAKVVHFCCCIVLLITHPPFLSFLPPFLPKGFSGEVCCYRERKLLEKEIQRSGWLLKKMKRCELCKSLARIYCESDQASLCWSCDAKVHSANFLVARHSRCLLCHSCQAPTRWNASGKKLEPATVSICNRCVVDGTFDDDGTGTDGEEEYDGDEDEPEIVDKEVRDDNQVVPWSSTPPPSASSSSSSEEFWSADRGVSMKRQRQDVADRSFEDDLNCSSVQIKHRKPLSTATELAIGGNEAGQIHSFALRSESIVRKLNRNRNGIIISGDNEAATVFGKAKATRAVGFDLNAPPCM